MIRLRDVSVRAGVLSFVAIAASNALLLCGLMLWESSRTEGITNRLNADVVMARAAGEVDMMHDALRATVYRSLLAGSKAQASERESIESELKEFTETLHKSIGQIEREGAGDELRQALAAAKPMVERYAHSAADIVAAALASGDAAKARLPAFQEDFEKLEKSLEALSGLIEQRAQASIAERDALFREIRLLTPVATVVMLAILIAFGSVFVRNLLRGLGAEPVLLRTFARRIAAGELHAEFPSASLDARSVAGAMLVMRDRLRDTVKAIREGADLVASGSAQIAGGNHELSERTERQASRLQEAAASMEQVTGTVRQTAQSAREASELADETSQIAQRGGESVQRAVDAMGVIRASSQEIVGIIGVIDGIAFQTNILALNAAVEAARAGAQGRGFAVVASEVRALAQRSAAAAREIKTRIEGSVPSVEAGHRHAVGAGQTMREVLDGVSRVTALIGEISVASSQQDVGVAQVGTTVNQIDHDTQRNAALVEQTAAAATTLSEQAERLANAVTAFELVPA